ncbi:hypothetical protein QVN60_07835 [Yersinia aleksiciae]|uniref:hypothetical protein n=1 Tax=Yersinia aleksiciae TaxID=263819 RepID=UPI0025AA520B|nr:hypothetical protein [Yersinia aleksiciae]MDN0123096.1 hypothetical protein [Yersinia aleksiciae]
MENKIADHRTHFVANELMMPIVSVVQVDNVDEAIGLTLKDLPQHFFLRELVDGSWLNEAVSIHQIGFFALPSKVNVIDMTDCSVIPSVYCYKNDFLRANN